MERHSIWVSASFAPSASEIYILPANHRGDMYHVRAAITLKPGPLVVHSCTAKTNELTDYLKKSFTSENDVFFTELSWDAISASGSSPGPGMKWREFNLISESMATEIIAGKVTTDAAVKEMISGMAIIDARLKPEIRTEMVKLCRELFPPNPKGPVVLLQCRDTGTAGGIYPELDSGTDAVRQIAAHIKAIPKKGQDALQPVLCGNAKQIDDLPGIGEYFRKIPSDRWPSVSKRDVEAFFLQVAFEEKFFHMVVGFRSGGLDLFSFLGAPSVSISVRQMVGELRHGRIAKNKMFKRWNLQYELPRHIATQYFGTKRDLLGSPWWISAGRKTPPTPEEEKEHHTPPTGFHEYDSEIIRFGIYSAIAEQLNWKDASIPFIKPPVQAREFYNATCRRCYFSDTKFADLKAFFTKQMEKEQRDFERRHQTIGKTNEPEADYKKWYEAMQADWKKIIK